MKIRVLPYILRVIHCSKNQFWNNFQLKQQKEERSKLLECLSKEKQAVSQIEHEKMQIIKDKEETEQKYFQSDQALKEVSEM